MKEKYNIDNWDLIAKYFANECSEEEIDILDNWLNENDTNKQIFIQVKNDLELINLNKSMNKVNVDSAWEKVKNRIQEVDEIELKDSKVRTLNFSSVLKYAAAIIVLVSIGFFTNRILFSTTNGNVTEFISDQVNNKEIVLPDGSTVVLNADSKLSYDNVFASNERRVKLEGEAFFDVTKNPEKPFVIETGSAEVKVLGTSFNVNTMLPEYKVEVFVETGLVELTDSKNKENKILIEPGKVGVLNNKRLSKHVNNDLNKVAWKTKELIFKENSLGYVISTINKVYNSNITCEDPEVLNLSHNVSFNNQEIDTVIEVICATHNLKVEYTDSEIKLISYN